VRVNGIEQFDAFSLLEFAVDWHLVSSAFRSADKQHHSRVLHRVPVAKNVYQYVVEKYVAEKPLGFTFRPGQAVQLVVDQPGWSDDKHPFTMTGLPDNPRLEFINKQRDPAHPQLEGP